MDIKNADVLDILNVIIEDIILRMIVIARFYTNDEFKKHLFAIKIAIDHIKSNIYQISRR